MAEHSAQWFVDRNHAYSEWRRAIREYGKNSREAIAARAALRAFFEKE